MIILNSHIVITIVILLKSFMEFLLQLALSFSPLSLEHLNFLLMFSLFFLFLFLNSLSSFSFSRLFFLSLFLFL